MAQILLFRLPRAFCSSVKPSDVPSLDVNLPLILHKMGALKSKAETRRLLKVLAGAMYALDILAENEWRDILSVLEPIVRERQAP